MSQGSPTPVLGRTGLQVNRLGTRGRLRGIWAVPANGTTKTRKEQEDDNSLSGGVTLYEPEKC